MRILLISNFFPPVVVGGYEITAAATASRLRELGAEVLVLTSAAGDGGQVISRDYDSGGISVERVLEYSDPHGLGLHAQQVLNRNELLAMVKQFSPDYIYVWNVSGLARSGLSAIYRALPQSKLVYHLMGHRREVFGWGRIPKARKALAVLCSRFLLEHYGEKTFSESTVLYSPVLGYPLGPAIDKALAHLGQRDFRKTFRGVFIGQLAPHKGVPGIFEAVRLMAATIPHLEVHLYSTGVHQHRIKDAVPPNVRIFWDVERTKILDELPSYDFGLFPTDWEEPSGMALSELLAMGLPTISTRRGGSAEVDSPLVVPVGSATGEEIAGAIQGIYASTTFPRPRTRIQHSRSFRASNGIEQYDEELVRIFRLAKPYGNRASYMVPKSDINLERPTPMA